LQHLLAVVDSHERRFLALLFDPALGLELRRRAVVLQERNERPGSTGMKPVLLRFPGNRDCVLLPYASQPFSSGSGTMARSTSLISPSVAWLIAWKKSRAKTASSFV
jgi:hypothetical protein